MELSPHEGHITHNDCPSVVSVWEACNESVREGKPPGKSPLCALEGLVHHRCYMLLKEAALSRKSIFKNFRVPSVCE